MPKIAVTTFYSTNYEPLAAITIPVLRKWTDKHGYHLNINKIEDGNKHHFIKTKDARKLLDEYDIVMAIENDILLTNLTCRIEDWIYYGTYLYLCKDVNNFNGGCFIVRNGADAAKKMLDFINSFETLLGDEQNVMEQYFGEQQMFSSIIGVHKHPAFNSIPYEYYYPSYGYLNYQIGEDREKPTHEQGCWQLGDFCCHLPGMTLEKRIEIFNKIKDFIIYE